MPPPLRAKKQHSHLLLSLLLVVILYRQLSQR
jgi:hypothetical protein